MYLKMKIFLTIGLLLAAASSNAAVYFEMGDASKNSWQAQNAGTADQIRGQIGTDFPDQGDVYQIDLVSDVGSLTIDGIASSILDPVIFLFGPSGTGIKADDDSGGGVNARITTGYLPMGTYMIGIAGDNGTALDHPGRNVWSGDGASNGGPPGGWNILHSLATAQVYGGQYTIEISSTAVPLPAPVALIGSGLIVLLGFRRREKGAHLVVKDSSTP